MTEQTERQESPGWGQRFKWFLWEPSRFRAYAQTIDRKEAAAHLGISFLSTGVLALLLAAFMVLLVVLLQVPALAPQHFDPSLVDAFGPAGDFAAQWLGVARQMQTGFLYGLMTLVLLGMLPGVFFSPPRAVTWGGALQVLIAFLTGPVAAILFCLPVFPYFGLNGAVFAGLLAGALAGLAFGLAVGTHWGTQGGVVFGFSGSILFSILAGFGLGHAVDFNFQAVIAGGFIAGWLLFYFRILPFYPFNLIKSLFSHSFEANPYLNDGTIWLPLPGLYSRLIGQVTPEPGGAGEFIHFLVQNRPLQHSLAYRLAHVLTASQWLRGQFEPVLLNRVFPESLNRAQNGSDSSEPASGDMGDPSNTFLPSRVWFRHLATLRREMAEAERQDQINMKLDLLKACLNNWVSFRDINTQLGAASWSGYYTEAFENNIDKIKEQIETLEITARNREPITSNIYLTREPLDPEKHRNVFAGRIGLAEQLRYKLFSSENMPIFHLHGQPKVGKTTFLNFLPHLLGSGCKVIYMDLHSIGGIYEWLREIQIQLDKQAYIAGEPIPRELSGQWCKAWELIRELLKNAAQQERSKIVLAFDGYEHLHFHFQKRPEMAGELLAAMRAFSLYQEQVAFVFAGDAMFAELKDPDWSRYFVQPVRLHLEYLDRDSAFRLITASRLEFPQDVAERMFTLTAGHPMLLQSICSEMVTEANRDNRRLMTMEDLNSILENYIYTPKNEVTNVFWQQFCATGTMKATVRQIVDGETPGDFRAAFTLSQHGFTTKEKGRFKMHVPIFQEWIKRFGE